MAELLPCPFCGGTDVHLRHLASASMSWVSCAGCGLEAPSETGVTDDAAVAYWNRRAAPPQPNVMPLTWLVAERGGLEAITDRATYRAASLASDYAILEIDGKRTDEDFPSVEAACRAAFADYARRAAPLSNLRGDDE